MYRNIAGLVVIVCLVIQAGFGIASDLTVGDSEVEIDRWAGGVKWFYKGESVIQAEYISVKIDGQQQVYSPKVSLIDDGVEVILNKDGEIDYKKKVILTESNLKIDVEVTLYSDPKDNQREFDDTIVCANEVFKDMMPFTVSHLWGTELKTTEDTFDYNAENKSLPLNLKNIKTKTALGLLEFDFIGGDWWGTININWAPKKLQLYYQKKYNKKVKYNYGFEVKFSETKEEKKKK